MEKSEILVVGCGGCGNNQLNTLLNLDVQYTGLFMNTNYKEMAELSHFNRTRNCFYIPNADGTGKDRILAEEYIKGEAPKFAARVRKYINQTHVIFLGSMNGGTGSKSIILLPFVVKQICPEKSLNIIATFPNLNESDIDFKNTIATWNELIDLKEKGIIDSIQFIDNNKPYSEEEINIGAMSELNAGFNVVGGKIDASDSKRVHQASGYKVILDFNKKTKDTNIALNQALNNTMFYIPETFKCSHMVANINSTIINLPIIKQKFKGEIFNKINEKTTGNSIVVLGGCDMPKEPIDLIQEALKENKTSKEEDNNIEDLKVINQYENKETKQAITTDPSTEDLNDIFSNPNFWDN